MNWEEARRDMEAQVRGLMSFSGIVDHITIQMRAEKQDYRVDGLFRKYRATWDLTVQLPHDQAVYLKAPELDELLLMWQACATAQLHEQARAVPQIVSYESRAKKKAPPAIVKRIGDAERTACVDAMSAHYQAGRMTYAEFDSRSTEALAATGQAVLDGLLLDMPAEKLTPPPERVSVITINRKNPVNALLLTLTIAFGILFLVVVLAGSAGV